MKTYVRFIFSQLVELWILWTAIGIVFIPNYVTDHTLLDLVWFYVTTFFAVLFATILLSRNIKTIALGLILFSLTVYLHFFVQSSPSENLIAIFTLPITLIEFFTAFLASLTSNMVYQYTKLSSSTQKLRLTSRTLAIKVFAFVAPLVFASLIFSLLDPQGVWSDQYVLHVMTLGTVVTYLIAELLFVYRDRQTTNTGIGL